MVVRRALAVAAVRRNLAINLVDEDAAAQRRAATARRQLRQRLARHVERQRLADQMGVRAEVVRQVALDVRELAVEGEEQVDRPRQPVVDRRIDEEIDRPEPGQRPNAELEHARPVDPDERRIRVKPACELLEARGAIPAIARQPERPAELRPVLMPIQFPDDLVIAARGIEKRDGRPESPRRAAVVDGIELPVRGLAVGGESEASIPEQIVGAGEQTIGASGGMAAAVRELRGNLLAQRPSERRADHEARRPAGETRAEGAVRIAPLLARERVAGGSQIRIRGEHRKKAAPIPPRSGKPRLEAVDDDVADGGAAMGELGQRHASEARERRAAHGLELAAAACGAGARSTPR